MSKSYKKYRPQLRTLFEYKCAYCEAAEPELLYLRMFHIDHYRPQKKFKSLINKYENLIYSCCFCNENKGDFWPSQIERLTGKIVINRRHESLGDHIDKSSFNWKGITRKGVWTVSLLKLASPSQIKRREKRQLKLDTITTLDQYLSDFNLALFNARAQQADQSTITDLEQQISKISKQRQGLLDEVTGQLSE